MATEEDARLLEWTVQVPERTDVDAAARSLTGSGYQVKRESGDAVTADPWGTAVRLVAR
jgi:hypothetical protein